MSVTLSDTIGGLVPQNFAEALRLAELMAKSKMIPAAFQGKPEDCLVVLEQAMRWSASPFAVIGCTSIIQGRPFYEGKLVAALINSKGAQIGMLSRLTYDYKGSGEDRTITVSGIFKGDKEARVVEVRMGDVKTANQMWKTQVDQQLAYSGARIWARRHAPELMLGIYTQDEFERGEVPQEHFSGTTIDAHAEVASGTTRDEINASVPWRETDAEKSKAFAEWMGRLDGALSNAKSRADVDAIRTRGSVQKMLIEGSESQRHEISSAIEARLNSFPVSETDGLDVPGERYAGA